MVETRNSMRASTHSQMSRAFRFHREFKQLCHLTCILIASAGTACSGSPRPLIFLEKLPQILMASLRGRLFAPYRGSRRLRGLYRRGQLAMIMFWPDAD